MRFSKTLHGGDIDSDSYEAVHDLKLDLNRRGERRGSLRGDGLICAVEGATERSATRFSEAGENPFKTVVVEYHLLMVAATLIGCSTSNLLSHQNEHFGRPSHSFVLEQLPILPQEP